MSGSVVVTGMGCITPFGQEPGRAFEALLARECALAPDEEHLDPALAHFPVARVAPTSEAPERKLDPFARLAQRAGERAIEQSGLEPEDMSAMGIVLGVGYGASSTHLTSGARVRDGRVGRLSPHTLAASMPSAAAAGLALRFGMHGPAWTLGTACASGLDALGLSLDLLRTGRVPRVLSGGVEAILDDLGVGGMAAARALSPIDTVHGSRVLRPFDRHRKGTAMGEAATLLVLETEEAAQGRGARILGRVLGYGSRTDAFHITAPDPEGRSAEAAVRCALEDAGLEPRSIGAVFAHGTGTPKNDSMEGQMLARIFGASPPPITSIKGQLGHSMGASGAVSSAFALLSMDRRLVPPTLCESVDPDCGIRPVLEPMELARPERILVEAFGFGGHNAALILGRGEDH